MRERVHPAFEAPWVALTRPSLRGVPSALAAGALAATKWYEALDGIPDTAILPATVHAAVQGTGDRTALHVLLPGVIRVGGGALQTLFDACASASDGTFVHGSLESPEADARGRTPTPHKRFAAAFIYLVFAADQRVCTRLGRATLDTTGCARPAYHDATPAWLRSVMMPCFAEKLAQKLHDPMPMVHILTTIVRAMPWDIRLYQILNRLMGHRLVLHLHIVPTVGHRLWGELLASGRDTRLVYNALEARLTISCELPQLAGAAVPAPINSAPPVAVAEPPRITGAKRGRDTSATVVPPPTAPPKRARVVSDETGASRRTCVIQ